MPSDCEKLVLPILGLYSLILLQASQPHIQGILSHIEENKDSFFPPAYMAHDKNMEKPVKRKLFGNLVALMEEHTARDDHSPCTAASHCREH